ncbi:lysophospholipid acyltransferase family protein [Fulvivirga maritima]|uniref:lysophospholipid acyltransferase family protein n=1 Tax=Fulvivirga maritima TaxID=2904247 RepID=UPI001F432B60|nr:lysophospholipid acyltransferase family protein [Fulvivirga maritima]UII27888.1 lysophospholipid acyltransferase family protein [Fulvivirga maritima]
MTNFGDRMFIIKLLSRLPLWFLYGVSDVLFFVVYYVVGYRKKVVYQNLKNSFPEKTEQERKAIAKAFYHRFMDFAVETLKAFTISEKTLMKHVKMVNFEMLNDELAKGKSAVVMATHQFNWELASQASCVYLSYPVDAVYQTLSNASFNKLMYDTRARFGGEPIDKSKILRTILKTKERVRVIAMVADQSPRRKSTKYWTTFLNQDTAFFTGAEQLAQTLNFPVLFFRVTRPKRRQYQVEFVKLGEPPYEKNHDIVEAYARETERLIRDEPEGYLWTHKRWKLKKEVQE